MLNKKSLLTVFFLAGISLIMAACGSNSSSSNSTGSTTPIISPPPGALTVTTASPLPAATVGAAYSQALAASGGTTPYTWTLAAGSAALPLGLNLSPAGTIAGTPTTVGTVNVNIQVTDAAAGSATKTFSITVNLIDGVTLYTTYCATCHGALTSPTRQHIGATVTQINTGIASVSGMTQFASGGSNPLSQAQIVAISSAMQ